MHVATLDPNAIRKLTRQEYARLVAAGSFRDDRIELLQGMLVTMSPQGARHAEAVRRLLQALLPALVGRAQVQCQSPLALGEVDEPEPDLAVVPPGDYTDDHPSEAMLVIEVSDTSLEKDRSIKAPLYASVGIPEYWIVNLIERVVEVHTEPARGRYCRIVTCPATSKLAPSAFPELELSLSELIPA